MLYYVYNIIRDVDVRLKVRYNTNERGDIVEIINITNARQNLYKLIADVNKGFNPINIVNSKGDDAVLISGSDWRDIEETIYLNSIPGYVDSVNAALKEDRSKCSVYHKGEKW